jgi:hypothetical protein
MTATPGITYYYLVTAVDPKSASPTDPAGESAKSAEVSALSVTLAISSGGAAAGAYEADTDFSGGRTYSTAAAIDTSGVTDPAPQAVYQHERYGNFTYTVPGLTPGASYTVRLHFAEIYWNSAGQRLFNVAINGATVLSSFDIYAAAGGKNKAVVEQFTATADAQGRITTPTPPSRTTPRAVASRSSRWPRRWRWTRAAAPPYPSPPTPTSPAATRTPPPPRSTPAASPTRRRRRSTRPSASATSPTPCPG